MNVLDHLVVFLPGPQVIDALFPGPAGLILDAGTRHVGQGTRNRRALFANCYLELVWIDSPVDARASGLRFQERCDGTACPFGVVFRGRAHDLPPGFLDYTVPNGPTLKILDNPSAPFIGIFDDADGNRLRTPRRQQSGHRNSNTLQHAEIKTSCTPTDILIPQISFVPGKPKLTLTLSAVPHPLRLEAPENRRPESWQWG